jgi:hypothetical protein
MQSSEGTAETLQFPAPFTFALHLKRHIQPIVDRLCLGPIIEILNIIFKEMDPGAYRERDPDGADDRLSSFKRLNLGIEAREVLFCAACDHLAITAV